MADDKCGWEQVAQTDAVDDETVVMTKFVKQMGGKNYHQMSLPEARIIYDASMINNGPPCFDGIMQDHLVPAEGKQPAVPITVYTPTKKKSHKIIVYLHGGGLIFGTSRGYAKLYHKLATQLGCVIIGVEYRLLPDAGDKYAPVDDCVHAVKWIMANKEKVGGSKVHHNKIGIMGDSSGGQLALLVGLEVKGIDFLMALYPVSEINPGRGSYKLVHDTPIFNGKDMEWITSVWESMGITAEDGKILPAARKDLKNMPPILVVAAGLDPLRDSVIEFAERLKKEGVKVKLSVYPGVTHAFFGFFDGFPKNAQKCFDEIEEFVNSH